MLLGGSQQELDCLGTVGVNTKDSSETILSIHTGKEAGTDGGFCV